MSNMNPVLPEDVLPDGVDTTAINGKIVRKGTIAAFLANADILENPAATQQQKQQAINTMQELAPAVITIGLHKHVVFRNAQVEQILVDAELSTK
ncbi:hypothetical protein AQUSIP_07180 [Aquicella siphonis]|uniref:Uncharacterized protein n=1 Tax=Aquicella siphonis TaxID=254247 RepID=A0A5E4PFZ8_9COXI|nr:hypothetical protein [Aquicella siphonis]VVC75428.1 hypothetical protein AQUSIP_07180 [Aquicella siphonis]